MSAYRAISGEVNESMPKPRLHSSTVSPGRRGKSPLLISVPPPTHLPSAYAMDGVPRAAHRPPLRYLALISGSENASVAFASIHGPSSMRMTDRPASARRIAVVVPPAPEPMTRTSVCITIGGRRRSALPCLMLQTIGYARRWGEGGYRTEKHGRRLMQLQHACKEGTSFRGDTRDLRTG